MVSSADCVRQHCAWRALGARPSVAFCATIRAGRFPIPPARGSPRHGHPGAIAGHCEPPCQPQFARWVPFRWPIPARGWRASDHRPHAGIYGTIAAALRATQLARGGVRSHSATLIEPGRCARPPQVTLRARPSCRTHDCPGQHNASANRGRNRDRDRRETARRYCTPISLAMYFMPHVSAGPSAAWQNAEPNPQSYFACSPATLYNGCEPPIM